MKLKHYIIGIVIVIIDQLSKILIINKKIPVIPNFLEFNYTQNTGGAFGIGRINFILIISIIIVIGIIVFLIKENTKITNYIPFVLLLSGSIGNLIDRIFKGYVIDFIDINILDFPNFNIADISIVSGVIVLLYIILLKSTNDNENYTYKYNGFYCKEIHFMI